MSNFFVFLLIYYWIRKRLHIYKKILINAITINEAKDSSEIENIITTHDELFKSMSQENYNNPAAKEVVNYRTALWYGYEQVKDKQILTTNMIVENSTINWENRVGIRKLPGTVLKNETTGEVVYIPPSGEKEILDLMSNLEKYINDDYDNIDPLIKLAVIPTSLSPYIRFMMAMEGQEEL